MTVVIESYDAHAAGTRADQRLWEVVQRGTTVTASVEGLVAWRLEHPDSAAARHTWQALTALAESAEAADEPVDDNADGW